MVGSEVLRDAFAPLMRADPAAFRAKYRKMARDPHAFYRGSACLFYADVTKQDDPFADERSGRIWVHGDLHVENFGTWRDAEDGHFLWPGYRDNLRPLLWLLQLKNGEVEGRRTAVGIIPTKEELDLEGVDILPEDLERILSIDKERWQQEMGFREEHLSQFDRMPEEIWEAHRRVAAALDAERGK